MSDSNRVALRYIAETVYGTAPVGVGDDWSTARFTSESFSGTPNTTTSAEIRSDRQISDMPTVGLSVNGGIDLELSMGTYDEFLEAALCGTWTTDVLQIGTTDRSFSFEKEFEDIGRFLSYTGMRVGSLELNLAYGSIITGSIGFQGNGAVAPATATIINGSSTTAPATTDGVMNASSDVGTVTINGSATGICLNSLSLSLTNNLREITCVGTAAPTDILKGSVGVTGSMDMYLTAEVMAQYGAALANTAVAIEYTVTDANRSYTFRLANCRIQGDAPSSSGLDQDVMFSANFTALYDATDTTLEITRDLTP